MFDPVSNAVIELRQRCLLGKCEGNQPAENECSKSREFAKANEIADKSRGGQIRHKLILVGKQRLEIVRVASSSHKD